MTTLEDRPGFVNTITTSQFQVNPDYYTSEEKCIQAKRNGVQTNSRYKNFKQTHFTAGDEAQFQEYRNEINGSICMPNIDLTNNIYVDKKLFESWEKYNNIPANSVIDTFRYLFHKFKKSIFVKIKDNKLVTFLPFSKSKYINEWGDLIKVDHTKYSSITDFMRHVSVLEGSGRYFNESRINAFTDTWYSNNCLVRSEYPTGEGDSGVSQAIDMLRTLCERRTIPDIEFFMNRRDFPLLKRDSTEPYHNIFGTENKPLLSHDYKKYVPVLSNVTADNYADIAIPTWEDWSRVMSSEGIMFAGNCRSYSQAFEVKWSDKKPTAVFRGGSTGCGIDVETNPRLKVSYLSTITKPDKDGIPLLDAGITNWNLRPRKVYNSRYLQTIEKNKLSFGLVDSLSPEKQSEYKYLINIDGHVSAFRLSLELNMGSVVLIVDSNWKMWFKNFLIPYVHYVPIKEDLSDLISQIKWCKKNDIKCEEIANNAKLFYQKYLSKDGILDYLQLLLCNIKKEVGVYLYNYKSPLDLQISEELQMIEDISYPPTDKSIDDINTYPREQGRTFGVLKGIEWIVNMVGNKMGETEKLKKIGQINATKLSTIEEYTLAGFNLAIKRSNNNKKVLEDIHETFVGTKCINNIIKEIPNFVYIFGMYKNKVDNSINVITEKIKGVTFSDYIESDYFNVKDFIFILLQVSMALQVAQNKCGFVHWDLYPWNIMIQTLPEPITFDYVLSYNKVMRVNTRLIPIIIDYGKSHVVYNEEHHGFINMYSTSTVQDIITLLLTSLHKILITYNGRKKQRLQKKEIDDLVKLSNFLTNTEYRKKRFVNIGDLLHFLHTETHFTTMISSLKYELEEKTSIDFINYVTATINYKFPINIVSDLVYNLDEGNARQVFYYTLSSTVDEYIKTFTDVFDGVVSCSIPTPKNLLLIYYVIQTMEKNLTSVNSIMIRYLRNKRIDPSKYNDIYMNCMKFLNDFYKSMIDTTKEDSILYPAIGDNFNKLDIVKYNENTFLLPETILELLKDSEYKNTHDITEYKDSIQYILLNNRHYKIPDQIKKYYIDNLKTLLSIKNINMISNIANYNTLANVSFKLATNNLEELDKQIRKVPKKSNIQDALKYVNIYEEIIKTIKND